MNAVLRDGVPAPSTVDPSVPAALDAICVKALSRAPGDRYATAADLLAALDAAAPRIGPPVVLKDVGALLGEAFASSRARTNALINAELKPSDGETSHERLVVPPRIMALAYETTESETQSAPIEIARSPAPSRRGRWAAVAVALVIGAILGGSLMSPRKGAAPSSASSDAPQAALAPAITPSEVATAPVPTAASVAVAVSGSPQLTAPAPRITTSAQPIASARRARPAAPPAEARNTSPPAAPAPAAPTAPTALTASVSPPAETSHCAPPFYFDEKGIKRLKPECF